MITRTIEINEITVDELADQVAEKLLFKIEDYLTQLRDKENDELMTRIEAANYLKVAFSTLWKWTKQGYLKSYLIGNKVYYNKKEIINYLKANSLG